MLAMQEGVAKRRHSCTDDCIGSVGSSRVARPLIDFLCLSKVTAAIKSLKYEFAILITAKEYSLAAIDQGVHTVY